MEQRIPTTIFTGFLGSGKTTVIAHLIDDLAARGEKVVYVKNEVGDLSTDALLLKTVGSQIQGVKELTNGCICCTLTGQLYHAVNELADTYHPDRIVIESAGTAKPHDLSLAISEHPRLLRDGVICVIDVVNFNGYDRVDSVAQRQASFTDLIVFNKVENVDEERLHAVVGYVREVNPTAAIIEAPNGKAPVDVLCGISSTLVVLPERHDEHHESEDNITAIVLTPKSMDLETYQKIVESLPKQVFRAKGVIQTPDGSVLVNSICGRTTSQPLTQVVSPSLSVIGYDIQSLKDQIERTFCS